MTQFVGDSLLHAAFCHNLRDIRAKKRMTQDAFAVLLDSSRSYVADLERGRNCPSLLQIEKISTALKVSPGRLLRAPKQISGQGSREILIDRAS